MYHDQCNPRFIACQKAIYDATLDLAALRGIKMMKTDAKLEPHDIQTVYSPEHSVEQIASFKAELDVRVAEICEQHGFQIAATSLGTITNA